MCLGVTASGYVGQWPCTSNKDQIWYVDSLGVLTNRNVDIIYLQHGKTAQGEQLVTFATAGSVPVVVHWMVTALHQHIVDADSQNLSLALGIYGGHANAGGAAVLWGLNDHPDQTWHKDYNF
jgi:hypothetical protein